ncbi:hypothetical protein Nepgr_033950 [Nepenthes gracilis]|uniref:Uncharacterized protein n=1 Tax=Nepenthes gracilis TaxID=150966 RepID=A0AAD3TMS8_NEPGR|nr:hypothetical protein Nepgr_033950 [Nepenthes gracilis]
MGSSIFLLAVARPPSTPPPLAGGGCRPALAGLLGALARRLPPSGPLAAFLPTPLLWLAGVLSRFRLRLSPRFCRSVPDEALLPASIGVSGLTTH